MSSYRFASIGSGSSGNCYYIEHDGVHLLVDAGVAPRTIVKSLAALGVTPNMLSAILITHAHGDHVRSVGVMCTRFHIPLYANRATAEMLLHSRYIVEDLRPYLHSFEVGEELSFGRMSVCSIAVPHDSSDNIGFTICSPAGLFALITDIGHLTEEIRRTVRRANFLVFESNYDREMLLHGSYPLFLKQRITSGLGHLSNTDASDFIAQEYHMGLKFLALCHLSKHNNHPELAQKTMVRRLAAEGIRIGIDLQVHTLKRTTLSPLFTLSMLEGAEVSFEERGGESTPIREGLF